MNHLISKTCISTFLLILTGCSSLPTRENNPDKFNLLKTELIKKTNIINFKNCLIEGFEVRDRIAYNVKTKHYVRSDGHRVESVGGDIYLLLSTDIFNSGKIQLFRVENSSLTDLSQQINAFDTCSTKYKK